ncbi:hypothetical protein D3C87_2105580 [compost metagenome]
MERGDRFGPAHLRGGDGEKAQRHEGIAEMQDQDELFVPALPAAPAPEAQQVQDARHEAGQTCPDCAG